MNGLKSKTALVTGAARGIGKAIALELAAEGCTVILSDVDEEGVKALSEEIGSRGVRSAAFRADISNAGDVESLVEKSLKVTGQIDILINNAGITRDGLIMRMKEEDWDRVIDVNLKGAFLCTRKAIREMIRCKSGKVINIASVVGIMGNPGQASYAASKAGLIGFTRSVAKEVASKNIQVNAVAPGFIETEMTASLPEEVKKAYLDAIPTGRIGRPAEVGRLVVFLASSDSDYITGQVIQIDGGLLMA